MRSVTIRLLVLSMFGQSLLAQTTTTIADHIVWERDFPKLFVSTLGAAAVDLSGNLWAVSEYRQSDRLLCIRSDGQMAVNVELPPEVRPSFPAGTSFFQLAVSSSGTVVLVVRYMHGGKDIFFDGAVFATVHPDGRLGPVKKVAGSGPEYKSLVALSDNRFLLLGDQSPMIVICLTVEGDVSWRRTFSSNWVLPSAAALEDGSSCIVSPDRSRALLHLIWLGTNGKLRHGQDLNARRSDAASLKGACTILYDKEPGLRHGEFFLTSFDLGYSRAWTTPVVALAPQGGTYGMVAASDGYVVTIGLQDGLFLAKYSPAGQLLWSATDGSRRWADLIVPASDSFYLIGAAPKDGGLSLHIVRAH